MEHQPYFFRELKALYDLKSFIREFVELDYYKQEDRKALLSFDDSLLGMPYKKWLEDWIDECSSKDFKRFVFLATGNQSFNKSTKIQIMFEQSVNGNQRFPYASTCSESITMPFYSTKEVFNERWMTFMKSDDSFNKA
jgi:hypothetical protein